MNSQFSVLSAIAWFGVSLVVIVIGWGRGNWILLTVGVLLLAVATWNSWVALRFLKR